MADRENDLQESWRINAGAWINLVQGQGIASRRLATDAAIVDAVMACQPSCVFDMGCGEGWLMSALAARGVDVAGADVVASLAGQTRRRLPDSAVFCLDYDSISEGQLAWPLQRADVVVCNFSLLGESSTERLLSFLAGHMAAAATLLIQTLHPASLPQDQRHSAGWRTEHWTQMPGDFVPAPWYYRPMAGWQQLLHSVGFQSVQVSEVFLPAPELQQQAQPVPASVILRARVSVMEAGQQQEH